MSRLPLHGFNGLFYLEMTHVESVCPQLRKRWFCPVGVCHPQSNLRLFICLISLVEELNYYIISRAQAWLCAYLIWPAQVYQKQILWYSSLKSATFFTANVMQTVRRSSLSSAQISAAASIACRGVLRVSLSETCSKFICPGLAAVLNAKISKWNAMAFITWAVRLVTTLDPFDLNISKSALRALLEQSNTC